MEVMETKVLLRLIRDDIRILEDINTSFINSPNLTPEETEVALARAKALVLEFEMLSKNLSRDEEAVSNEIRPKSGEKEEKKIPSLRNLLPFLRAEEAVDHDKPKVEVKDETEFSTTSDLLTGSPESSLKEKTDFFQSESEEEITLLLDESEAESDLVDFPEEKIKTSAGKDPDEVTKMLAEEQEEPKFGVLPLKSLQEGIGLNDRFLFIRELFQNDAGKLEQAISFLDESTTIEEAVRYLKQNYKWNKSEAAEKFLYLIKRRFAK